jgi:hypothetical protein
MPADAAAPPPAPEPSGTAAPPPSLAAALAGHAGRHPHRAFLFWPEGLDWRWASFAEAAAAVERLRGGGAALPEERGAMPDAAAAALREIAGPPRAGDSPALRETPASREMAEVAAGALAAAAGFRAVLATGAPARPRRQVVVVTPPFADEGARLFFAAAVVDGAAVIVEPSATALVATAAWARPTIFRGGRAEVAALAGEAAAAERCGFAGWWRRLRRLLGAEPPAPLPFGRLHTVLVAGPSPADDDLAFWRRRGARVLADPPCDGPAGGGAE